MLTSFRISIAVLPLLVLALSAAAAEKPAMDAARAKALRECNAKAEKFAQYTWGVTQLQVYRACMAGPHQAE
jgi:hypothetical protein